MKSDNIKYNQLLKARVLNTAQYVLDNNLTVREAAEQLGKSKTTIHKDMTERLRVINPELYAKVREHLDQNIEVRHLRGGQATKKKYAKAI